MLGIILIIFGMVAAIFLINSYQNKYQSFQGIIFNLIIIVLLLFFLISIGIVYTQSNANLTSFNGIAGFFKAYLLWLTGFFKNTGDIAGYAIKQNWIPNSTLTK